MAKIGSSDLDVFPLCLGGNVFGWTADVDASRAVLDGYVGAGGNFIDTSDSYMWRIPGNSGGESEAVIGDWLADRGNRDGLVIATKVGSWPARRGLSAANIAAAARDSLRRLRTDHIDLYYAHKDDLDVPQEEAFAAFDVLVRDGLVRAVGVSNFSAARLRSALGVCRRDGLTEPVAVQPQYNLVERVEFESELAPGLLAEGLSAVPYYGLARGFLTGKYRPGRSVASERAEGAQAYLDEGGIAVLDALDEVAAARAVPVAAVALAWLVAQPTVAAAIASARTPEQLADLLPMATLELSPEELGQLDAASGTG